MSPPGSAAAQPERRPPTPVGASGDWTTWTSTFGILSMAAPRSHRRRLSALIAVDREFEHRAFLVDHAVELAVRAPTEMTTARQFAHILRDSCDPERRAIDGGVVPVGVPDENRIVGRDCIEFPSRKIPALQKIVEIGADYPLPFRRARGDLLQIRNGFSRVGYLA